MKPAAGSITAALQSFARTAENAGATEREATHFAAALASLGPEVNVAGIFLLWRAGVRWGRETTTKGGSHDVRPQSRE